MAHEFVERLSKEEILFHYAPLHSLLADWGKDLESHLSQWILSNPDKFQDALIKSYKAGCTLGCTSTQAASPWRAETFGVRDKIHEFNYESAKLTKEVTPPGCYVLGMVSTTNPDFMEPLGKMTYQEVYDGYKEQIAALLEGGTDLFIIAGNHLPEALVAIKVARSLCDLPIISQNIFYATKHGHRTMLGEDPIVASAKLEEVGVEVIGGSCGLMTKSTDPKDYYRSATNLVREMRKGCSKPLSMQPNAGMAQLVDFETVYPAPPEFMAEEVENWVCEGARLVGGCCGTNLEHYKAISERIADRTAAQIIKDKQSNK
jgi:5-methyltetrahydrofolate--homocysteine methyltransferase